MSNSMQEKTHITWTFGEIGDGKYNVCCRCNSKTMLVIAPAIWDIDSEPFAEGEKNHNDAGIIDVDEEISGHYCPECRRLTSLSFNQ